MVVAGRRCVVNYCDCSQLLGCIPEIRGQAGFGFITTLVGSSVVFLRGISLLLLCIYLYSRTSEIALPGVNMKLPFC